MRNIVRNINQEGNKLFIEKKPPSTALIELSKTEIERVHSERIPVTGLEIVHNLMRDLNKYFRLREGLPEFQRKQEFSRGKMSGKGKFENAKQRSFVAALAPTERIKKRACGFCNNSHLSEECTHYNSIDERSRRAKKLNLYFRYLKKVHNRQICKYDRECYHYSLTNG